MEIIAVFLDYSLDMEKRSVWKIAHPSPEALKYPFVVNESGVFYTKPGFFTKRYAKDDYQILYTSAGAADMIYEGKTWRLDEGSIAVIDCNNYHDYRTAKDVGHWTYHWIHVGGANCGQYYSAIYKEGFKPFNIGADSELLNCFQEAIEQIDYTTDVSRIRLCNAVGAILTKMMVFIHSAPPSAQEAACRNAQDFLKAHYDDPLDIDTLATHLNLSKYYLIKLFNKHVGMTPYRYLILCRIGEAKKLLRATDHKVSAIAHAVGFADTSNFSRTFTRVVGITPAKYRDCIL